MAKPIRGEKGQFNGSIGEGGKNAPMTPPQVLAPGTVKATDFARSMGITVIAVDVANGTATELEPVNTPDGGLWETRANPNSDSGADFLARLDDAVKNGHYGVPHAAFRDRYQHLAGLSYTEAHAWLAVNEPEVADSVLWGGYDDEFYDLPYLHSTVDTPEADTDRHRHAVDTVRTVAVNRWLDRETPERAARRRATQPGEDDIADLVRTYAPERW